MPRLRFKMLSRAFRANVPQLSLTVNRAQAATLNVDVGDIYNTAAELTRFDLRQPIHAFRP